MNVELEDKIARYIARGFRISYVGPTSVILTRTYSTNAAFHLFATFFTCGLWLLPWLVIDTSRRVASRQIRLYVNADGSVTKGPVIEGPFDKDYNRYGVHEGFFRAWKNFREELRKD